MAAAEYAAQLLMVVQVFVTQRQPVDALPQHLTQLVLHQQRRAAAGAAARSTQNSAQKPAIDNRMDSIPVLLGGPERKL